MSIVQFTDREGASVGIKAADVGTVCVCGNHPSEGCVLVRMMETKEVAKGVGARSQCWHLSGTTVGTVVEALNKAGA